MEFIPPDVLAKVRQMDLLTYLQNYEPYELVRLSGNNYCTREHDSLKISNGKWHWFSRGIGGRTALDYLVKVKEYTFPEAVNRILGKEMITIPSVTFTEEYKEHRLLLPVLSDDTSRVETYLKRRGIHPDVIRYCIGKGILAESKDYHNAVFIGRDYEGKARYAAIRSTVSSYKGDATGSDKHFSFSVSGEKNPTEIHLFEAAIDLLSYITLDMQKGVDWKYKTYISLAGVFIPKRKGVVPIALSGFLERHPEVKTIHLHLDNDEVGRGAAQGIIDGLSDRYEVLNEPPLSGKDVNDYLQYKKGMCRKRYVSER